MPQGIAPISRLPISDIPHPPDEEQAAQTGLPADDTIVRIFSSGEDFAGSLPQDESGSPNAPLAELALSSGSSGEDFAGSLPADETSQAPARLPEIDWSTASIGEDFAGSFPFEEGTPGLVPIIAKPPQLVSSDEDFAGALPFEEGVSGLVPLIGRPPEPVSSGEDFAGSLPADEYAIFLPIRPLGRWLTVPTSSEGLIATAGFAEEHSPAIFLDRLPTWITPFPPDEPIPPKPIPPPPPPPPKPKPFRPSKVTGSGGGSGILPSVPYCPPEWLKPWIADYRVQIEETVVEVETDFALLHVTPGAPVRALAAGVVETFIDQRGRASLTLLSDDGTKYWYAEVGTHVVSSGVRVKAGEVLAYTKSGEAIAPTITPLALPPASIESESIAPELPPVALPARPTQIVFVQAPQPVFFSQAATSDRILVRLVPVGAAAPPPPELEPPSANSVIARVAISVGVVGAIAVLLYALSTIQPAPPPKKKRKRKRKKGSLRR